MLNVPRLEFSHTLRVNLPWLEFSHIGSEDVTVSDKLPRLGGHLDQVSCCGPGDPHIQVFESEVRGVCLQPHNPSECQPLAGGVGESITKPEAPGSLLVGEPEPAGEVNSATS